MQIDRETIIKLARAANRYASEKTNDSYEWQELRDEHFAKLVAEHSASVEREAVYDIHYYLIGD